MRILLIYPDLGVHVNYPVGLGIVSAVLKRAGHTVKVIHLNEELGFALDYPEIKRIVEEFEPHLIGFSSTSNQFRYIKLLADFFKQHFPIPIICGGVHPTIAPEEVLGLGSIDMICRGEGEYAIAELVDKMDKGQDFLNVRNLWIKRDGNIIKNSLRPLVKDLDSLPFPDRESFDFSRILKEKRGWVNLMAGRGCPYQCSYCVNHYYQSLYKGLHPLSEQIRLRSVSKVIEELEALTEQYSVRMINFDDDTFTLNKGWLSEFCREYRRRWKIPFACNVRPNHFDQDIAKMLKDAGCAEVKIGLESGSSRVRKEILNRNPSEECIIRAFDLAKEAGIRAWAFTMIGIPTETKEDVMETIGLAARIRPYILRCAIFYPYKGTNLHKYCREKHLLDVSREGLYSSHLEGTVLKLKELPLWELIRFKQLLKWYVDAASDIEAAPLFESLLAGFEKLPEDYWLNGKAAKIFKKLDRSLDGLLKEARLEHYSSRKHLDLNFCEKWDYKLP